MKKCDNCGKELTGTALKWKGFNGFYCSSTCACLGCPCGKLIETKVTN